eukprot:gene34814-42935_t
MGSAASQNSEKYSAKSSSDDIMKDFGHQAQGRHFIVTGANIGLGFETARSLAAHGGIVTLACRSKKLGDEAVAAIKKEIPDANVSLILLDLGNFASIRSFASSYKLTNKPLHVMINNAAVMDIPKTFTSDGLEMQFGVNHIGHFLLTTELLDVLKRSGTAKQPSRVVNVSSIGNWVMAPVCGIRFDDLKGEHHYSSADRYGSAKLANILFTKELNQRCAAEGTHVISVSLHPGIIYNTGLARSANLSSAWESLSRLYARKGAMNQIFFGELKKNPKQGEELVGTATQLFCALSPDILPGEHYADCHVERKFLHEMVGDEEAQKRLWTVSEEIVKA